MTIKALLVLASLAMSLASWATSLTAQADGIIATILVDRSLATKSLPAGLELIPAPGIPNHLHPAIVFLGQHKGLSTVTSSGSQITVVGGAYNELTYGIPSVRARGQKGLYVHLTTLLLDSTRAITGGWAYGFPKLPANFEFTLGKVDIFKPILGDYLVSASISQVRDFDQNEFSKNFSLMKQSIPPLIVKHMGEYKCIDFNWNFDSAFAEPAQVKIHFHPDMSKVVHGTFMSPGLDKSPLGTVHVKTQWVMSEPRACK